MVVVVVDVVVEDEDLPTEPGEATISESMSGPAPQVWQKGPLLLAADLH